MSNTPPLTVRDSIDVDPRVARTTHALGRALVDLIQERDFSEITVQNILDRAGVGRTTFYAHYRNKEDVLHSRYERLFVALESVLDRPSPLGRRLFPVAEFLEHVGEARPIVDALRSSGQLEVLWALCVGYAARIIERRIDDLAGIASGLPRPLAARMLAGALMEAIEWWQDHPSAASPAAMDAAFHQLARALLHGPALGLLREPARFGGG